MDKAVLLETVRANEKALNILRCNSQIEKTTLAKKLDISFPTLIKQLDEMKRVGILLDDNRIEINRKRFFSCGISIGGSQCKITFVDAKYNVLGKDAFDNICKKYNIFQQDFLKRNQDEEKKAGYRYFNTPDNQTDLKICMNAIIKDLISLHEQVQAGAQDEDAVQILSVGVAITGSIDATNQIVIRSHNVEYLKNMSKEMLISPDVLHSLRENQISFIIDHNAKALAVCEKFSLYQSDNINNAYCEKKNIASLYLGSGIGCGLILDNTLVRGCRNLNGELGHIQVPRYPGLKEIKTRCSCGATGCLEHYIINDVFNKERVEFKHISSKGIKEYLNNLGTDEKEEKLRILGHYIGWSVDLIVKLLNVDLVIFSGKMTCFMDELWQYITPVTGYVDYAMIDCAMIVSKYGALAPAIGAGIMSNYEANHSITWYDKIF